MMIELVPVGEAIDSPTETSVAMITSSHLLPAIPELVASSQRLLASSITTGRAATRIVEGCSSDDCTFVNRVDNDMILGDRTEVTRTFLTGDLAVHLSYTVERLLTQDEEAEWAQRLSAAKPGHKSFEILQQEAKAARQEWARRLDRNEASQVEESAEDPLHHIAGARRRMLAVDKDLDPVAWTNAAFELGKRYSDLNTLLDNQEMSAQEITLTVTEGLRYLRHAAQAALQIGQTGAFLRVYEALATSCLFDVDVTRARSLQRAESGFEYLIDRTLESGEPDHQLLVKKAIAKVSRSVTEGEELLDAAMALLFPVLRGDTDTSIKYFQLLIGTGSVWHRAAERLDSSFHKEALAFFDFAEAYCRVATFSIFSTLQVEESIDPFFQSILIAQMGQRSVQWNFQGRGVVGDAPIVAETDHIGSLLFLRPLLSSRRFLLKNKFDSSPHLIPYAEEPPELSLEAALHRTLNYRFATSRMGGPSDVLGMGNWMLGGAARTTASDNARTSWKGTVQSLMKTSAITMILLWSSEGVLWEIDHILSHWPEKCVLIMLPVDVSHDGAQTWEAARSQLQSTLYEIPQYRAEGGFYLYGPEAKLLRALEFSALWSAMLSDGLMAHVSQFKNHEGL